MKKVYLMIFFINLMALAKAAPFYFNGIWYELCTENEVAVVASPNGEKYKGELTIPADFLYIGLYNYKVIRIEESAFENCSDPTSIILPPSVVTIAKSAFKGCSNLKSVLLSDHLNTIEAYAFYDCIQLNSISFPSQLTAIGAYAFFNSAIATIKLSGTLPEIEETTFSDDIYAHTIIYADAKLSQQIPSIKGWSKFSNQSPQFEYNGISYELTDSQSVAVIKKSSPYSGQIILPEQVIYRGHTLNVSRIDDSAFEYTEISAIRLPNSLTSIGKYAFRGCEKLTAIIIPKSVISIEKGVFSSCPILSSIVVETGNTMYDSRDNCNAIIETRSATLISGCNTATIPNTCRCIGEGAFFDCQAIDRIQIPEGIIAIKTGAFSNCQALISVHLPNSLVHIENSAFNYCMRLQQINMPKNLIKIGTFAFSNCPQLKNIAVEGVTPATMAVNAFSEETYQYAIVTFPTIEISKKYANATGWNQFSHRAVSWETFNQDGIWYNVGQTEAVVIADPNGKDYAGGIDIPSNVMRDKKFFTVIAVDNNAFAFCTLVTHLTLPIGITKIGDNAFKGCRSITDLNIPIGVTTIGEDAFALCSDLGEIVLPSTIAHIGEFAFRDCTRLTKIVINSSTPVAINANVFSRDTYDNAILFVPSDALELYHDMLGWKNFAHIEEISNIK